MMLALVQVGGGQVEKEEAADKQDDGEDGN